MTISMFSASVPVIIHNLLALSAVLKKAVAHAEATEQDPGEMLDERLAPDMFPLIEQVQFILLHAKGIPARLAGIEVPGINAIEGTEKTFDDLQESIAATISFLRSFEAEQIDGTEMKPIEIFSNGHHLKFTGQKYLLGFGLPNIFFHYSIAYGILRSDGVPLGKMDFLG